MKAVIVGCGAIADRWARTLTADPRIDVVAVVDPDIDRAEQLAARRCPAAVPATSLRQAHAQVRADLVANLTPPQLHAAVSREALAAGLHVLTEKPLALQASDAVELAELARANRRTLAVMHNRAHDPEFVAFADMATAAQRGPLAVTAEVVVNLHDPGFRREQPLPVTTDLAVHAFDQVQALISGDPAQVAATEMALPFLGAHCGLAAITITFADGSVLCYRGGYAGPGLTTSAVGKWRVDGPDLAARWEPRDQTSSVRPPAYQRCITTMLDTVQAVTAGAVTPWPTLGLRSVAMLQAALTAARTGRPADVSPIPQEQP
ncbi:Gfo/Idh/MocA family protein [Phytohabitans kaempferiae]|uniref:Gfo/Idh/MocA family protein n=1 Tax=Phytohabitans kaempferiae TaxID=1620943 RepID=A0ABV6MBT2_9ACTN